MDRLAFLAVLGLIFAVMMDSAAAQTVHIVGDGMGWDIPNNSSVSYVNWASGKTFMVGDILEFNFITGQHDVVRVAQGSYEACSQDNSIGSIITTGPANVTLDSGGDRYYICTFGSHCRAGQKLAIRVVGSSDPPMTAPPATPSPASPQPDACAPTPSSAPHARSPAPRAGPPPPDSASTSLPPSFLLVLLSALFVLMF